MNDIQLYTTGRPDIIWPDYSWRGSERYDSEQGLVYDVELITYLRLCRDGVYWFKRIQHKITLEADPSHHGLHACYSAFIHELYNYQILAKPDSNIVTNSGEPVFWRDPVQESEEDRLNKLLMKRLRDDRKDTGNNFLPGH